MQVAETEKEVLASKFASDMQILAVEKDQQLDDLTQEAARLAAQRDELATQLETLQSESQVRSTAGEEAELLKQRLQSLEQREVALTLQLQAKDSEIDLLQTTAKDLELKLSRDFVALSVHEALRAEVEDMRNTVSQQSQEIQDLSHNSAQFKEDAKQRSLRAIEKIKELNSQLEDKSKQIQSLESQLESFEAKKSEVTQLTNQSKDLKRLLDEERTANLTFRQELETRDIQIVSYEEAVAGLRKQLARQAELAVEKDRLIVQINDAFRDAEKEAGQLRRRLQLPRVFDVLLRCSDGRTNWCLIRWLSFSIKYCIILKSCSFKPIMNI